MNEDWASDHLQVIRTLMERSAVYRHALAPIMAAVGLIGIVAAIGAVVLHLPSWMVFAEYWTGVALLCVLVAFLLVRRQAFKKAEAFWSPPTRGVTQALLPGFFAGLVGGLMAGRFAVGVPAAGIYIVFVWMFSYGCAMHAAGSFMPRGVKWFGWCFVLAAVVFCLIHALILPRLYSISEASWIMGIVFGGAHWAYATYLFFTEPRVTAS